MKTILIVEDEPAIARVLAAYLRNAGFGVQLAEDGHQALEFYAKEPPSLYSSRRNAASYPRLGSSSPNPRSKQLSDYYADCA